LDYRGGKVFNGGPGESELSDLVTFSYFRLAEAVG